MATPRSNAQLSADSRNQSQFKAFDKILNFRDVGKTINDFLGEKRLAEGRIFRSARPDDASAEDRRRLVDDFNIRTIIDLRTDTEHAQRTSKQQAASTITTSKALPPQIPHITYHSININGPAFSRALLFRLPFLSITRLLALMAIGRRIAAIRILGEGVMQPRGLIGLGCDSLEYSGKEIMEVLDLCADALKTPVATPQPSLLEEDVNETIIEPEGARDHAASPAVLIHCTQGKDRTGLIVMLILLLLDIPVPAIAFDYGMSEAELESEREERLVEVKQMGLGEEFVGCPEGWVEDVVAFLEEKWGGVREYLESVEGMKGVEEAKGIREVIEELRRELFAQ